MDAALKKQNGIHYTPAKLAQFLARQTALCISESVDPISVLDPACGDGELLASMVDKLINEKGRSPNSISVVGYDIDAQAVMEAEKRLERLGVGVKVVQGDFLNCDLEAGLFDCVVSNPPYVRTQVLGGTSAQKLAKKFDLRGRIDLYQAFVVAIHRMLRKGAAMGLLTSNRFLTVKSGLATRRLLQEKFELKQIFDLGDTRLFDAAVLPSVVCGNRRSFDSSQELKTEFHRVYCSDVTTENGIDDVNEELPQSIEGAGLLELVQDPTAVGDFETIEGRFSIERGELLIGENHSVWALANQSTREWLKQIQSNQVSRFADLAEIKVGIKTTADSVFIRDDWAKMGERSPEPELVHPLITHHDATRWGISEPRKSVLYPYKMLAAKRTCVELSSFPNANAYLQLHRSKLEGRRYLIDAGRSWFEIWVTHQPTQWAKPKIVWPDISEQPRFFLNSSGAIVNGDCYWIKLRVGVDPDWLYLILAVANSTIAIQFYDTMFHNKLYAGRRRFMTQYVNEFPLPSLNSSIGKKIVRLVKRLVETPNESDEQKVESLVHQAFGFGNMAEYSSDASE